MVKPMMIRYAPFLGQAAPAYDLEPFIEDFEQKCRRYWRALQVYAADTSNQEAYAAQTGAMNEMTEAGGALTGVAEASGQNVKFDYDKCTVILTPIPGFRPKRFPGPWQPVAPLPYSPFTPPPPPPPAPPPRPEVKYPWVPTFGYLTPDPLRPLPPPPTPTPFRPRNIPEGAYRLAPITPTGMTPMRTGQPVATQRAGFPRPGVPLDIFGIALQTTPTTATPSSLAPSPAMPVAYTMTGRIAARPLWSGTW
jgi:hypothetical protein